MRKQLICLALLCALLTSVVSCGEAQTETTPTTDTTDTTAATETTAEDLEELDMDERAGVSDGLPELDFGGEKFHVMGYDYTQGFLYAEELTGETFNDALYNRNTSVADRFNVKMTFTYDMDYGVTSDTIKTSVLAGEDTYDLVAYHYVQMGNDLLSDIYLNMRDLPHIDFSKPWWNKSTSELLTYKDRTFLAFGSFNLTTISQTSCVFYNQDIAEQYELEDIFTVVNEGRWTLDKMIENANIVYKDIDGNGTRESTDQYGYVFSRKGDLDGIQSYGKMLCEFDADGNLVLDKYYDEKLVSIIEKLYDIQYNQDAIWSEDLWNLGITLFNQGTTLAGYGTIAMSQWGLRELDIDYAIIPPAKWEENQENYYSTVGGSGDAQAVLRTAGNLEKIGAVTEALNAESWKTCERAYYENTIKYKSTRSEENLAVLDMIMENRVFDFGGVYGGWENAGGGATFWVHKVLNNGSSDISSFYQSKKKTWENYMQSVLNAFENYSN